VQAAGRLEDLQGIVEALRHHWRVDHCVYHWVSADGQQYGCGTYARDWCIRYVVNDYLRIDPVVIGCFQRAHPIDWKRLDWSSKAARAFRADSIAHGVGSQGFSVPIRGPSGQFALFSVSSDRDDAAWAEFTRTHQREVILAGLLINQTALDLASGRMPEPARGLSPRETDALTFLAMGYGRGQVADMLSISEHTLRAYIEGARLKLGALNTVHAVARAVSEGLIVTGGAVRFAKGGWPAIAEKDLERERSNV
jgi:DNA-binding CsgD family transcriptional regulator